MRWLYEVMNDFGYSQVTFSTAILLMDRYTEKKGVKLSEYQLIGISGLFLSAKVEERECKRIEEYMYVTESSYGVEEILVKEREMVEMLEFSGVIRLPHSFLRLWYLERICSGYSISERQEIMQCGFSCVMERNTCGSNMYWIYLEGMKEAEKVFSGGEIETDLRFYLENNKRIKVFR